MNISAVIPLYNAEQYIIEALNSLLNQTYPIDEILVIDDCSTDRSVEIVQEYSTKHPKIKIIELSCNQGVSAARNHGIIESRNDWILMMDADDTIHPELIQAQIARLIEYSSVKPKPVCVHPAYMQTDLKGRVLPGSEYYGQQLQFKDTFGALLLRNYIITASGLLINREAALDIGGYNTKVNLSEDYEFLLRLSRKGTFVYLDKPYVYYRRHLSNASNNMRKMTIAGQSVLSIYTLDEIREAIFCRNFNKQKNLMDFVTLLYQNHHYEEGYQYLSEIEEDDLIESKLFYQALYFIELGDSEKAIPYLDRLILVNDRHGAALNNLGVLHAKMGNKEEANVLFEKSLSLFPGYMDATHNLTCLDQGIGEFQFTKRELRKNLLRYS